MNKLYTYVSWCCILVVFSLTIIWFGFSIADACNACFARVGHAVLVRDKMKRCAQKQYKRLCAEYTVDMTEEMPEEDQLTGIAWSAVSSESYGPERQIKKRKRTAPVRKKNRQKMRSHAAVVDPEAVMTHRNAPFSLPLERGSFWMSSRFGPRPRADGSAGFHYGIDLAANKGTPVYAARSGIVIYAGHDNGYGKTIVLQHGSHFKTRYAHLDKIWVKTGDTVTRGSRIGAVGATGYIRKKGGDGSHLHFEVYYQGKRVDPLQFLPDFVS